MSTEAAPDAAPVANAPGSPTAESWEPLSPIERRVLGVMVEKAKTTPDAYPLSLNALTTGCNQKSNRDPMMNLVNEEVEAAMDGLKKRGLAQQILGGGRVDKIRHVLYEAWRVDKVELAILGELLLRGAQTEGELRTRASRMEPINDLDTLRQVLTKLAGRGLIMYLGEPGRRGVLVTHGFHTPEEKERLLTGAPAEAYAPAASASAPPRSDLHAALAALQAEVRDLQARVAKLEEAGQEVA